MNTLKISVYYLICSIRHTSYFHILSLYLFFYDFLLLDKYSYCDLISNTFILKTESELKMTLTANVCRSLALSGVAAVSLELESPLLVVHVRADEKCTHTVSNISRKM